MQPLLRPDRRTVLTSLSFGAIALSTRESFAQGVDRWFPIKGDDGKPVANLRLPVELTSEVDELKGLIRIGAKQPDVTVVEFYDYNCPFCRKAAPELENAIRMDKGLQLGLVNNPILSAGSKEAAKHELAILKLAGSEMARRFHLQLFEVAGRVDAAKALTVARELGFNPEAVSQEVKAPDVNEALDHQLRLAASMGLAATQKRRAERGGG